MEVTKRMAVNMLDSNFSKQENKILNSFEVERAISYLQIVKGLEKTLLQKFISLMPIESKGRNLCKSVTIANGSLAKAMGVSSETIGRLKESLHAKGIIEVDGKNWQDYRYTDGNRFRAKWIHCVTLSSPFLMAFYDAAKTKQKILFQGAAHPEYIEKIKARRKRNLAAVIKSKLCYVVNNLLNSCETYTVSSLCQTMKNIPMNVELNLKEKLKNTITQNSNPTAVLKKSNENLTNALGHGKRAYKIWTESVKKICLTLLESGKTAHEVAAIMVKQSYCKNYEHFVELMQLTPMLC